LDRILLHDWISGDDWQVVFDALCDKEAIERIAMMQRQRFGPEHVVQGYGQNFDLVLG